MKLKCVNLNTYKPFLEREFQFDNTPYLVYCQYMEYSISKKITLKKRGINANEKKMLSLMLVFTMVFGVLSPNLVLANKHNVSESTNSIESMYSDDAYYKQLKEIEFTSEEILELYQNEANKTQVNLKLPEELAKEVNETHVYFDENYADIKTNSAIIETYAYYDGEIRNSSYSFNIAQIARYFGWTGAGTATAFLINNVTKTKFTQYIVSSVGLGTLFAIVSIAGVIFGEIANRYGDGFTTYTEEMYQYDTWEGFGKWYLLDIYRVWW